MSLISSKTGWRVDDVERHHELRSQLEEIIRRVERLEERGQKHEKIRTNRS